MTVSALRERGTGPSWRTVDPALRDRHAWVAPDGGVEFATSPRGLAVRIQLSPFGPVVLAPDDVPAAIPVGTTSADAVSAATGSGSVYVTGLDGATEPGRQVATVPALPRQGTTSDLVDLGVAERFASGPAVNGTYEVWMSPDAPASIVRRLAAAGITVTGTDTVAGHVGSLSTTGVSLAYVLFLVAAVAAVVLALGTTAFSLAMEGRRRAAELAAMRTIGIPVGVLRRSIALEQALTLVTGMVLGVAAGVGACLVALRSLPEFATTAAGPPLHLGIPVAPLALIVIATSLALLAIVAVGSRRAVRLATVDALQAGQP